MDVSVSYDWFSSSSESSTRLKSSGDSPGLAISVYIKLCKFREISIYESSYHLKKLTALSSNRPET